MKFHQKFALAQILDLEIKTSILGLKILILGFQRGLILDEISDFLKIFQSFFLISENIGMKKNEIV